MKVIPYSEIEGAYAFTCPGCGMDHHITTKSKNHSGATWSFNGDLEKPTFSPSINVTTGKYVKHQTEESRAEYEKENLGMRCHFFIREGRIQFCGDCTHPFSGQTMDLPDLAPLPPVPGRVPRPTGISNRTNSPIIKNRVMTKVSFKKGTEFTHDGVHYQVTGFNISAQEVKLKVNGATEQTMPRKKVGEMMLNTAEKDGLMGGEEPKEQLPYKEYKRFKMKNQLTCTVISQDAEKIHYQEDVSGHKATCSRKFFETDLIPNRDVTLL